MTSQKVEVKSWTSLSGKTLIFKNTFTGSKGKYVKYSTVVSTTDEEDNKHSMFVDVQFSRNCKIQKSSLYEKNHKDSDKLVNAILKNAFLTLSFYQDENGKEITKPKIVVLACDFIDKDEA